MSLVFLSFQTQPTHPRHNFEAQLFCNRSPDLFGDHRQRFQRGAPGVFSLIYSQAINIRVFDIYSHAILLVSREPPHTLTRGSEMMRADMYSLCRIYILDRVRISCDKSLTTVSVCALSSHPRMALQAALCGYFLLYTTSELGFLLAMKSLRDQY